MVANVVARKEKRRSTARITLARRDAADPGKAPERFFAGDRPVAMAGFTCSPHHLARAVGAKRTLDAVLVILARCTDRRVASGARPGATGLETRGSDASPAFAFPVGRAGLTHQKRALERGGAVVLEGADEIRPRAISPFQPSDARVHALGVVNDASGFAVA